MGDYNPNTPQNRGLEVRPSKVQRVSLTPGQGIAMRVVPGVTTWNEITLFIESLERTPGLALEVLTDLKCWTQVGGHSITGADALNTMRSDQLYYPNTDSGAVTTGWSRQDGSTTVANLRGAIDDFLDTSDYIRNINALVASSNLKLGFRGAVAALTGLRIAALQVVANYRCLAGAGTSSQGPLVKGLLNIGGVEYPRDRQLRAKPNGVWQGKAVVFDPINPATNVPWTLADINAFIQTSTATDEFGVLVSGASVPALAFQLGSLIFNPWTIPENRRASVYTADGVTPGWAKRTLNPAGAETAANYYLHAYALGAGKINLPLIWDPRPDLNVISDPAAVGEHRTCYATTLTHGGIIATAEELPGRFAPAEFSVSGTYNTQSQVYADVVVDKVNSASPANSGQQITSPSGTPPDVFSIRDVVGWESATQPAFPLEYEVRHGVGSLTGGGTLDAVGSITGAEISQELLDRIIDLDASFTPAASTSYVVLYSSDCPPGAGYAVARADTRSDLLVGAVTAANVEGQSQGGQTDSYVVGGAQVTRYDRTIAFVCAPGQGTTPDDPTPTPTPIPPLMYTLVEGPL